MSDSKEEKNTPLRLPPELRDELTREIGNRMQRHGKRPTYGELLAEAWAVYKACLLQGGIPMRQPGQDDPVLRTLRRHPRLLELLAGAATQDLEDMETYLQMRREVRKKKAPKE